jgi:hypothetical protein
MATRQELIEEYLQKEAIRRKLPYASTLAREDKGRRGRMVAKQAIAALTGAAQPTLEAPDTEEKAASERERSATVLLRSLAALKSIDKDDSLSRADKLKMRKELLNKIVSESRQLATSKATAASKGAKDRVDTQLKILTQEGKIGAASDKADQKRARAKSAAQQAIQDAASSSAGLDEGKLRKEVSTAHPEDRQEILEFTGGVLKEVGDPGSAGVRERHNAASRVTLDDVNAEAETYEGAWQESVGTGQPDLQTQVAEEEDYVTHVKTSDGGSEQRKGKLTEEDLGKGESIDTARGTDGYDLTPQAEDLAARTSKVKEEERLDTIEALYRSLGAIPNVKEAFATVLAKYGGKPGEDPITVVNRLVELDEAAPDELSDLDRLRTSLVERASAPPRATPVQAMAQFQRSLTEIAEKEGDLGTIERAGGMGKFARALVRAYRRDDTAAQEAPQEEAVTEEDPIDATNFVEQEAPVSATPTLDEAPEQARIQGEEDKGGIPDTEVTEPTFQALTPIERARREAVLEAAYPKGPKPEGVLPVVTPRVSPGAPVSLLRTRQGGGVEVPRRDFPWETEDPERALDRLLLDRRNLEASIDRMRLK